MPNTQNEQVKTDTSFEENYIDENVSVKTNKTKEFIKKFMKRKTAVAAFFVMCFLLLMALFGPSLAPYAPEAYDYDNILAGPSASHLFGTDQYGRDIFSRILAGTPLTLGVSLSSVIVGAALGTVLGLLAGYYGGWIEMLVMRGADVLFSFPDILLAIAIVAAFGANTFNLIMALSVGAIPTYARTIRASVLGLTGSEFVEAAKACGAKDHIIILKHIIPNSLAPIIVRATLSIGGVLSTSSLSYLGLGVEPHVPEWGNILKAGSTYLEANPYLAIYPGLAIILLVLAFNYVGDGLRDALDPKLK